MSKLFDNQLRLSLCRFIFIIGLLNLVSCVTEEAVTSSIGSTTSSTTNRVNDPSSTSPISVVDAQYKDTVSDSEQIDPDAELILPDHRFFLQEIFKKYGYDGQITFEGFEHLLGNLKLGNVIIEDHDVKSHKDDHAFVDLHNTHEHSGTVDNVASAKGRRGERAHKDAFDLPLPKHRQSFRDQQDDHSHTHKDQGGLHHSEKMKDYHNGDKGDHNHQHASTNHYHYDHHHSHHHHNDDKRIPELLENISAIVDQHSEIPKEDSGHVDEGDDHHEHNVDHHNDEHQESDDEHHEHDDEHGHASSHERRTCLNATQMLTIYGSDPNVPLDPVTFLHLCPAIIYELEGQHCFNTHDHGHKRTATPSIKWLYSCVAVLLISLCGLFSVGVIPIMQKWFYRTLLQFLVGLAVGSLSGDAMLHLLPHAMLGGEEEGQHDHGKSVSAEVDAVWRGLTGLGGIYFFFIAERLLNFLTVYRRQKREKMFRMANAEYQEQLEPSLPQKVGGEVGEKLSHYRRNSYGLKINPDAKEDIQMHEQDSFKPAIQMSGSRRSSAHEVGFHGRSSFSADPVSGALYLPPPPESVSESEYVVTFSEHHGHSHGHSHEVPQSVSAVAWMVIMGDGLHNFCDGMAIGAAFASSIAGGISTTVAVFCHELPHELGDFAMLLKTGMTVKRALLYNCLSSILCLIGMAIGVSLGSVNSATSWIFAGTAGMFLYIALVDMLPELATANDDPMATPSYTLAVQVLGISIGVSVMLLIAIYEHDLKNIVS